MLNPSPIPLIFSRGMGLLQFYQFLFDSLFGGFDISFLRFRVSGIRKLECGMRKIRKSVCMRSNLIFFFLMLVNQNFIGDDEKVSAALLLKELRWLI